MISQLNLPRILRVGGGASQELAATLVQLGLSKPLIVTDPFIRSCPFFDTIFDAVPGVDVATDVFADCVPDPTTDSVRAGLSALNVDNYDCLVAIGGGSSMDTAKAMAAMQSRSEPMRQYKVPFALDSGLPIIAIPTTAGTGSEVTKFAVITDTETQEKMLWIGLALMPVAALVDYELTMDMPYRLTADTGLDTLCHALEAFVSRKANAFTDPIALDAMRSVVAYLPKACADPSDREAREAMMLAATQGGVAFANASVTLIHGMSRPIGAHYHVPHGLSNAMLLPVVTAWSVPGAQARYAIASRHMGFAAHDSENGAACEALASGLRRLCSDLSVPTPASFGIDPDSWHANLPLMAEQALASGSPNNNPRVPSVEEIVDLYRQVFS
ncbi:MAG: iron-containing alcohol dehydrogenase [Halieaceae bacterium]|nr:iron-containing alcohol dehydrogenase [Halieaceae bacterium]